MGLVRLEVVVVEQRPTVHQLQQVLTITHLTSIELPDQIRMDQDNLQTITFHHLLLLRLVLPPIRQIRLNISSTRDQTIHSSEKRRMQASERSVAAVVRDDLKAKEGLG